MKEINILNLTIALILIFLAGYIAGAGNYNPVPSQVQAFQNNH